MAKEVHCWKFCARDKRLRGRACFTKTCRLCARPTEKGKTVQGRKKVSCEGQEEVLRISILGSVSSWIIYLTPSRPSPDCLIPPYGI